MCVWGSDWIARLFHKGSNLVLQVLQTYCCWMSFHDAAHFPSSRRRVYKKVSRMYVPAVGRKHGLWRYDFEGRANAEKDVACLHFRAQTT